MEIVQILINAYVVLDGQETIVNFQYVMESIPPIYLSATREEFVLLLIIVLAIQIMKVFISWKLYFSKCMQLFSSLQWK
jgi:hypothetical protein